MFEGMKKVMEEAGELAADWNKLDGKVCEGGFNRAERTALEESMLRELGDLEAAIKITHQRLSKEHRRTVNESRDTKLAAWKTRRFPGLREAR